MVVHMVSSHFVNFPFCQFSLCQQWPNGNWQNENWQSGNWQSGNNPFTCATQVKSTLNLTESQTAHINFELLCIWSLSSATLEGVHQWLTLVELCGQESLACSRHGNLPTFDLSFYCKMIENHLYLVVAEPVLLLAGCTFLLCFEIWLSKKVSCLSK